MHVRIEVQRVPGALQERDGATQGRGYAEGAPLPALKVDQLKGFFRQKTKEKPITSAQLAAVKAALPE